jgi:hypothetical protein
MGSVGGGLQREGALPPGRAQTWLAIPCMSSPPKLFQRPCLAGRFRDAKLRERGPADGALTTGIRMNGHVGPLLHGDDPLNVVFWA